MDQSAETVSVEEYLRLDAEHEGKLELLNGVVVAMAGASLRHNVIVTNVARSLGNALEGSPCLVVTQDQRIHVESTESYVYPDVVVVCDAPELDTRARPASLRNPSAVVEVLSESTLPHDLGPKLGHYRRIPSLKQVLFIHAQHHAVTLVTRQEDGTWTLLDRGPSGAVELVGVTVPLDSIYARTDSLPG